MLVTIFRVCSGEKAECVQGEVVGISIDEEDALDFNALQVVQPMIERMPVEQAPDAYAKMMRNECRFRMVAVHYISPHSFHSVLLRA
jgi:alcohol dehydrogenase